MRTNIFLLLLFIGQVAISQSFKYGKVSKEEIVQAEHSADSSASAAILYREYKTNFEHSEGEGFYAVIKVFERIKIYSKEGLSQANVTLKLYQGKGGSREEVSSLKGHTYFLDEKGKVDKIKMKKDGIFDEELNKYRKLKKFVLPSVKAGSVIEYQYTIKTPFYQDLDTYRFQEEIPVDNVSMSFKAPEYFTYKLHERGWIPLNMKKLTGERKMEYKYTTAPKGSEATFQRHTTKITFNEVEYIAQLKDVPAIKKEAFAGNIENYLATVKFELAQTKFPNSPGTNYATNWETVSASIYRSDSFGGELSKEDYYKADIDRLLEGVTSSHDKMMAIYDYVKSKMNWDGFRGVYTDDGVKKSYRESKGSVAEINLMLVSMLRYAGVNASPILVSTKDHGVPIFPTRSGFNYVICGVEVPNDVLLLDATIENGELNVLQPQLLNWQGRIIRNDGSSTWVSLYPKQHANINSMIKAVIGSDLSVNATAQKRFTGHHALEIRNTYAKKTEDAQRKELEDENGEIEVTNIKFSNLETLNKPVSLSFDFKSFGALEEVGGKLMLSPLMYMAQSESPFKLNSRKYPIDFGYTRKHRIILTVEIPEGYVVESMPEATSFRFGQNLGSYRYNIKQQGNTISINTEFAINSPLIDSSEYETLKGFYQLLIEKETEKVVLSRI